MKEKKDDLKEDLKEGGSGPSEGCLRAFLYILGVFSIVRGIVVTLALISFSLPKEWAPFEKYIDINDFRLFNIILLVATDFLYYLVGCLTLYGTHHSNSTVLFVAFVILGVKYGLHGILFFDVIFFKYTVIERNLSYQKKIFGEDFLLTVSVISLMADLILMANNSDFRHHMRCEEKKLMKEISDVEAKGELRDSDGIRHSPTPGNESRKSVSKKKSEESIESYNSLNRLMN